MPQSHSLLAAFEHPRLRALWWANLLSNFGSWGQTIVLTWQVSSLSHSASLTGMVQTALWLPMILLAIPAGILSDTWHKPNLLFWSNTISCIVALGLFVLTSLHQESVNSLLLLCLLSGCTTAFTLPTWQASVSELVHRSQLRSVAALNNLSYNLASFLAPMLVASFMQLLGVESIYLFNACSFLGLISIYYKWQTQEPGHKRSHICLNDLGTRLRESAKLLGSSAEHQQFHLLLLSGFGVFCMCSSFPTLMPILGDMEASNNLSLYSERMAALGSGAVFAAFLLPYLRRHLREKPLLFICGCTYSIMLFSVAWLSSNSAKITIVFIGGLAWSGIVTCINGATLGAFPNETRSRGIALMIITTAMAQAIGGILWGQLADHVGATASLCIAAFMLLDFSILIYFSRDFLEHK